MVGLISQYSTQNTYLPDLENPLLCNKFYFGQVRCKLSVNDYYIASGFPVWNNGTV